MSYYVYILLCCDDTYYTGSTNNIEKRLHEHNHAKNGAHYTKIRRPVVLKYVEKHITYAEARAREAEIKRMNRKQKEKFLSTVTSST
jgi:putative endonuclease